MTSRRNLIHLPDKPAGVWVRLPSLLSGSLLHLQGEPAGVAIQLRSIERAVAATMTRRVSDKKIVAALQATMGKVFLAAEQLGCLPEVIYARARVSRKVRGTIRFFRGKMLDAAESVVWKAILAGESWAARLALAEWGPSRQKGGGPEAEAPLLNADDVPAAWLRRVILEMLNQHDYLEYLRARQLAFDSCPVRREREPRAVENDPAPVGDRPGDRGDGPRANGADSGD
jgi:hypothetical protein